MQRPADGRDARSDRQAHHAAKRGGRHVRIPRHIRAGGTYPGEAAAREGYQVVRDAHAACLAGSYDAAAVTTDASGLVHENKGEPANRPGAGWGAAAGAALGVIFPPAVLGAAAAGGVTGTVSGHLAREMSRSEARQPCDFTGPGQAGLGAVGGARSKTRASPP